VAKLIVSEAVNSVLSPYIPHRRPWNIGHPRRAPLSQGNLRLAHACGMLSASGRGMVKWGGFLQIDLAP
jgi:hypothetical protein